MENEEQFVKFLFPFTNFHRPAVAFISFDDGGFNLQAGFFLFKDVLLCYAM